MEADRIAQAFVDARTTVTVLQDYPGTRPSSLEQAYAIQDRALAIWDRTVGGWKVGRINPPLDGDLGADRLAGPIFADSIIMAGPDVTAMPVFDGGFAAIEAEFMLRIAPPPGYPAPPATNAAAMDWVSDIRIGLEIASSPYRAINRDGPCVTVSDHGNNMGILLGARVTREEWGKLDHVVVALDIDGQHAGRATTAQMLDGPFGAVRFLLANLHARGHAPQDGWWISTGAITGVHQVRAGQQSMARFDGLGEIAVAFSAAAPPD